MKITNFFDRTYCINLSRRLDRWEESLLEFKKHDLQDIIRFEAVDSKKNNSNTNSWIGLVLTNIQILETCIKDNLNSVLILEDDVEFNDQINDVESFFTFLPNDWDMIYFGGNHNTHWGSNIPKVINEKVYKLHLTYSSHCIGIHKKAFHRILERIKKSDQPLDVMYAELQKSMNVYSFYPALATQRVGYSDIENRIVDYKWLIK